MVEEEISYPKKWTKKENQSTEIPLSFSLSFLGSWN